MIEDSIQKSVFVILFDYEIVDAFWWGNRGEIYNPNAGGGTNFEVLQDDELCGQELVELRDMLGLTRKDLGDILGTSRFVLEAVESVEDAEKLSFNPSGLGFYQLISEMIKAKRGDSDFINPERNQKYGKHI